MTESDHASSSASSAASAQTTPPARQTAPAAASPRTLAHVAPPRPRIPRARPYLRLLWMIPSAAILAFGLYTYLNVEPGGAVDSIKLTTKPGLVGQASESLRLVTGNFDIYLKIKTADDLLRSETYKDRAIGNGLVWPLARNYKLADVREVDVWDEHTFRSDKNVDHISMNGQWSAEGQLFVVNLGGKANAPPSWALPMLSVGATLTGLVILRFVWDQVV